MSIPATLTSESRSEKASQAKSNEAYTVGWICAIATEFVAAQSLLDEKHEGPEAISTNDDNDYALGKIGRHNVAIAVLPLGEYGLSSAASVASNMRRTFPNIRIGLMVGIGSGAPSSSHDIRLGDVVVGVASNGKAVHQYDYGKTIQSQDFIQTGFLNQSPSLLRTAVHGLIAKYEMDGHQILETIQEALKRRPRMSAKYRKPAPDTDRLYDSDILHPIGGRCPVCSYLWAE
jgi:hypothetical protein